jgi:hypothetical protein
MTQQGWALYCFEMNVATKLWQEYALRSGDTRLINCFQVKKRLAPGC